MRRGVGAEGCGVGAWLVVLLARRCPQPLPHGVLHHPTGTDDYRRGIFDIYIYIYIYDSLQLGCVPVLLPQQRVPMDFMLGGILRRANLKLDDVFYFLVRRGGRTVTCVGFLLSAFEA